MQLADVLALLSQHIKGDIAYYLLFLTGQCVYILKRAAMAIRSKTNPIKSRREFISANWDILGIRTTLEFPIYFVWRHYTLAQILAFLHLTLNFPFNSEQGPFTYFVLGFASDTIFDWISTSDKIPAWVQNWIKEQVPDVPTVTVTTVTTQTTSSPQQPGAPVTTVVSSETKVEVPQKAEAFQKVDGKWEDLMGKKD